MSEPSVTIVLPTYNRARFLPQAFASIRAQDFTDWELIVVDDGSTDNSRELTAEFSASIPQPLRYVWQENQGAYGARNTGLNHARGRYIAFFDSDDEWLPSYLSSCVDALESNCDVDLVFAACRVVNEATGREVVGNTFYKHDGEPHDFMKLEKRRAQGCLIIDDPRAVSTVFRWGLASGLQNSVIRARLFGERRFEARRQHETEDQLWIMRMAANGVRFAYIPAVHVVYRVHAENSSAAATSASNEKLEAIYSQFVDGLIRISHDTRMSPAERKSLHRRISSELVWHIGHATYWRHGRRWRAVQSYLRGVAYYPWDWRYWKTLVAAAVRLPFPSFENSSPKCDVPIV